jgi:hypothetical protein
MSRLALAVLGCALAACGGGLTMRVTSTELATSDGLACRAHVAWIHEPVRDVFLVLNGTGTGSNAFVPETLREVLHTRAAAMVTIDKPGIRAPFGHPASATVDGDALARHTQGTLVECAEQALRLAPARGAAPARWHLRGHSEGATVSLFLMERLLADGARAAEVATLVLSGLALEPFDEIVRRQLADKPRWRQAVETCDWAVMREAMGVSCAYIADAGRRPSGAARFERLAAAGAKVKIRVVQGELDEHTPARFVRGLEAWNATQGHLDLIVDYHAGGHRGTPEARRALTALLLRLASPVEGAP